jgi:8-oxo-dGTP pyrophosphatase MutT (NUDIX family)
VWVSPSFPPDLERISSSLSARRPTPAARDEPFHEAAVALVLYAGDDGLEALFIKRATHEGDPWSGQIALPGGKRHPDEPLMQTAMRETHEETGFSLEAMGTLLGELDEIRPRTPILPPIIVRPYVFVVPERPALVLSDEVAEAFWAPLGHVYSDDARTEITINVPGLRATRPAIGVGEHVIWGMTEHILRTFEQIVR